MVAPLTWLRYVSQKFEYAVSLTVKSHQQGAIADKELGDFLWKNFLQGKMTFITHWNKSDDMAPMMGTKGGTLLVRKIPRPDTSRVFVGDIVVLTDPIDSNDYLVRQLTAVEGYEMASKDETDEPFVLVKDQCWVVANNKDIKPKDAKDSRTFGPVSMSNIMGRVIYCMTNSVSHGRVRNSLEGHEKDAPVLEVELDVDELAKNHKD